MSSQKEQTQLYDFNCEKCGEPFKTDVPFKEGDDDIPPKCLECFHSDETAKQLKKFIKDALAANDARDLAIINRLTLKDEEEEGQKEYYKVCSAECPDVDYFDTLEEAKAFCDQHADLDYGLIMLCDSNKNDIGDWGDYLEE